VSANPLGSTTDDLEIRSINSRDGFLEAMLFEAFFWDRTAERPAFASFQHHPEFAKLISGWGRRGDRGVIAEESGTLG